MDLGTVARRARDGAYAGLGAWCSDVALIVANCRAFNPPGSEQCAAAGRLEAHVAGALRGDEAWAAASAAGR